GIVQGHHGAIIVSSEPGKGTAISVLFPGAPTDSETKAKKEVPAHPVAVAKTAASMFSGTVLIADDEMQVRSLTELVLKRMGLWVLSAEDGESAIELFRRHAAEITFVLVDLTMPKIDGLKTLAEMRRIKPDVKVVLTSGYDSDDLMRRYNKEEF